MNINCQPSLRSMSGGLLVALAAAALLGGCGYTRQARDVYVMRAVPEMQASQTLNPDAGQNRKVVAGVDGAAAKQISESYNKSFERSAQSGKASESYSGLQGLTN
jgi:hypothetical protein